MSVKLRNKIQMNALNLIFILGLTTLSGCKEVMKADKGPNIIVKDKNEQVQNSFSGVLSANDNMRGSNADGLDSNDQEGILDSSTEESISDVSDVPSLSNTPAEIITGTVYVQNQSSLYADYNVDENGFGPWKIDNLRSDPTDDYTRGALARCHNGTTIQSRECFSKGDPSKCLGLIEKEVNCADLNLHVPSYSAWTKAQAVGSCENGLQTYQRSCISLDESTPSCYGPAQFSLPCGATADLNKINEKFKMVTSCQPSAEANNHYATLCGGATLSYNGVSSVYHNCYINEQGQTICPDEPASQSYCFLPTTICSSDVGENMVSGTTYPNQGGGQCGILVGSSSDPSAEMGFSEFSVPLVSLQSLLGEVQNCGAGNKRVEKRSCVKNAKLPKCMFALDQVTSLNHKDSSCTGDISKIVSCDYGSSYQNLNRDGAWSEWKTVTGCHQNNDLSQVVKVQERECLGTRRAGQYCEGDKVRYVACQGIYDDLSVKLLVDQDLASNESVNSKIQNYKSLVAAKGADIDLQVIDTSSMDAQELRALINSIDEKYKLVSLIGDFPYAEVALLANHRFSSATTDTVSDFPFMLDENAYAYDNSTGLYHFNPVLENQDMEYKRIIFRTDFSNHSLTRSGLSTEMEKYAHYFDKVIAFHQNENSGSKSLSFPTQDIKALELVDEHWDSSTSTFQTSVKIKTKSFYGINKTNRGGFKELFSESAGYGLFMVHGNGDTLSFTDYAYMPSNGYELNGSHQLVKNISSQDIFSDIDVKVPVLGMFNCYSLSPDVESNVGNSFLLGQKSDVIASYGAYGSGSIMQWSMIGLTRTLLTGDSVGQAVLRWSQNQKFGTSDVNRLFMTYKYNAMKWHIPVAFAGDPLARTLE